MPTSVIRQKLLNYLADADEEKIEAIYTLLEREIEEGQLLPLSPEQIKILEEERQNHIRGVSKSYSREEAQRIIRSSKAI